MKDGWKQSIAKFCCAWEKECFASDLHFGWIWMDFHRDNKQHLLSLLPLQLRELNCDVVSHKLFQNDVHMPFYGKVWLIRTSTWSATNNWLGLDHVLCLRFTAVQNNWSLRKPGGPDWKMCLSLTLQHLECEWKRPHSTEQKNHRENKQHRALVARPRDCSLSCLHAVTSTMAGGMLWYINPKVMHSQFLSCSSWCNALFLPKPS